MGITGCGKAVYVEQKEIYQAPKELPNLNTYPSHASIDDITIAIDPHTSADKNRQFFNANLLTRNILALNVIFDNNRDNTYSTDKSDINFTNPRGGLLQRIRTDDVVKAVGLDRKKISNLLEKSIPEKIDILPQAKDNYFLFYLLSEDVTSLEGYSIRLLIYSFEERIKKEINISLVGAIDIVRELK